MTKPQTKTNDLLSTPKKRSFGSLLYMAFFAFVVGSSIFVGWQQKNLSDQRTQLETSIEKMNKKQENLLQKEGYDKENALINGHTILDNALKYRIGWSKIYENVIKLEKDNKVAFYNFSANRDKKFSINGITSHIGNLSTLLKNLKGQPKKEAPNTPIFASPFISQIREVNKEVDGTNQTAFTFSLSFEYQEQ